MKKLKTSDITDSASMPLKSGSLDFIQAAYQEITTAMVIDLLGYVPDPTKGYIMFGASSSNIGSTYTITDGYIYFNGEIFRVAANTFNLIGGQQIYGIISNVPYPNADPVLFGDNIQRTVHLDRIITFTSAASGDILYSNCIRTGVWLTGDLKEIDCTNTYLNANFDGTGLGKNERLGWAICNGNNGTKNRNGQFSMAYGTSHTTLGATGGESTHTLTTGEMPSHTHEVQASNQKVGTGNLNGFGNSGTGAVLTTDPTGSGLPHNNLPPYIVTLFIQKI